MGVLTRRQCPAARNLFHVLLIGFVNAAAVADTFVPFVIPGEPNPASLIAAPSSPITTDTPRVLVDGEHFVQNGQRLRIWGVNNSFGGNFPTHAQAERMAKRLAAAGVNSMRLHHMDTSRWPAGIWDPSDGATIYTPALERLDYFIDQLAQHGIWINLNLHVGRKHSTYLGLPDSNSSYDKVAGIFTPQLVAAQRGFAFSLLNHVNQYRGMRYADDPAIAFVEITNEDSFFMWDGEQRLRNLPPFYANILKQQYNDWLLNKYGSRTALETAWAEGTEPLGENLLTNGNFQTIGGGFPQDWFLEQHGASSATWNLTQYAGRACLQLNVTSDDGVGWHLQMNQSGLTTEAGRYYTLSFDAASSANRPLNPNVGQAHPPWSWLGLGTSVSLTPNWQSFRLGFFATASDTNARVNFAFGGASETVYLTNVEFRPGGQMGLLPNEDPTAGSVDFFVAGPSKAREMDRLRFLTETEKNYFDAMRTYIRDDIGCDALVTGTIVFGPLGLYAQQDMDFIDAHAYWRHPSFPGRPWDPSNWLVTQDAMTDNPQAATLFPLAARRLAGKPYTVSEYNHSAPNDYQAECIPMLASFAAAQDWDGIWVYSYVHASDIWDEGYFKSFFDIANNPAKWGFMRAGAAMFRDGGLGPLGSTKVMNLTPTGDPLSEAVDLRLAYGDSLWSAVQGEVAIEWSDLLAKKLKVSFTTTASTEDQTTTELGWRVPDSNGRFSATGEGAWSFTGWAEQFAGGADETLAFTTPEFAAVSVTALDANTFEASRQLLVTASGRSENTNMRFSADRRTVGTNWGTAPVRIEAVNGLLRLPPGRWRAQRLAPDGTGVGHVPTAYAQGYGQLLLSPAFGTLWYHLAREIGDLDGDNDVDFADAIFLNGCLTGPETTPQPACERLDLAGDNDLDTADVALFQRWYTG